MQTELTGDQMGDAALKKLAWHYFPRKDDGYRSYQEDAFLAIVQAKLSGKRFAMMEAPTGAGKSITAYTAAKTILQLEPVEDTKIHVVTKKGIAKTIPSRVETDTTLKGTKRIIVRQGNVYIGKGRKDERSIVVIPILSGSSTSPNVIEYLVLLHVAFKEDTSLDTRIKALGGKYEHIKNIVQENSIAWDDQLLERIQIEELFGRSAEKVAEFIVADAKT